MYSHLARHWSEIDFSVVDVEGNGQIPLEIIEIAVVHIQKGVIQGSPQAWLIKPDKPVTQKAMLLHGITNEDLSGRSSFKGISKELQPHLEGRVIIGHNVSVDVRLIGQKLPQWVPPETLDTLKMARHVFPGQASYTLEDLCKAWGIQHADRHSHRADSDAAVTAELFLDMAHGLDHDGKLSLMRLIEIAGTANSPGRDGQQGLF
jgi:exodeoxyribonuclease X